MSPRIWKIVAISSCFSAALASMLFAAYIAVLVTEAANIAVGVATAVLAAESLARRVVAFVTWWWPEWANAEWLEKNPPLFRLDRLRKH